MKPPWTRGQLERLGEALAVDASMPSPGPAYDEVIQWYADLAAAVQLTVQGLDLGALTARGVSPVISARAKTLGTLRDKLNRGSGSKLPTVQDLAGVRVEAPMTLGEQDAVVAAIAQHFGCPPEHIKDLRDGAHSGYRAVHIWLRLEDGRVEIQVRTELQGAWANVYERLADRMGRGIRYGRLPTEGPARQLVTELQDLSRSGLRDLEAGGEIPEAAYQQMVGHFRQMEVMLDQLSPELVVEMEP